MTGEAPDFAAARDHVIRETVRLERRLRRRGVAVPANAALPAAEALAEVGLGDRERARAAMQAALVQRPEDRDHFEEAFAAFWRRLRAGLEATAAQVEEAADADDGRRPTTVIENDEAFDELPEIGDATPESGDFEDRTAQFRGLGGSTDASASGVDLDRRPGTYSAVGERTPVKGDADRTRTVHEATMRRFEYALVTLCGRRWASSRNGTAVDARRALRESMTTGGVTMSLPTRERKRTDFSACVLVDVSRSVLDAVDRGFLLSTLDTLVADGRSVRTFFFDTEIRDVTDVFADARGDPEAALERAEVAWGGGTRIGLSLLALRRRRPDAVDWRTVTLVVSDGLEVGETDDLREGLSWLSRRSRTVLWLNPLATSTAWAPTCRGMEVALPFVDGVFAFGGDEDLDDAARQLSRHGPKGPVGYEYDFRDRGGVAE